MRCFQHIMFFCAAFVSLSLAITVPSAFAEDGKNKADYHPLKISTENGDVTVAVRLALSQESRAKGLMYVTEMGAKEGMLFIYPRADQRSFWMRNTYIPLDMIYIKRNGRIESIRANVPPRNDTARPSKGKVLSVLELNGGAAKKLGIKAGDMVHIPRAWRLKAEW